jgi:hypothetical protein
MAQTQEIVTWFVLVYVHVRPRQDIHNIGEASLWQSYPRVPCAPPLQASDDYEPLTSLQGDRQRDPVVWMEAVRKLIHPFQNVVSEHGSIPDT